MLIQISDEAAPFPYSFKMAKNALFQFIDDNEDHDILRDLLLHVCHVRTSQVTFTFGCIKTGGLSFLPGIFAERVLPTAAIFLSGNTMMTLLAAHTEFPQLLNMHVNI